MPETPFTFSLPIQARWNDLDPLGHVNNAIYISYFEIGRGRYMLESSPSWDWNKHMFLIGKISCTFSKELTLNDVNPTVWVRTSRLGSKSFVIEYAITSSDKKGQNQLHATGESVQIMFDMGSKTTILLPEWLRTELGAYEKEASIR